MSSPHYGTADGVSRSCPRVFSPAKLKCHRTHGRIVCQTWRAKSRVSRTIRPAYGVCTWKLWPPRFVDVTRHAMYTQNTLCIRHILYRRGLYNMHENTIESSRKNKRKEKISSSPCRNYERGSDDNVMLSGGWTYKRYFFCGFLSAEFIDSSHNARTAKFQKISKLFFFNPEQSISRIIYIVF